MGPSPEQAQADLSPHQLFANNLPKFPAHAALLICWKIGDKHVRT
jgi:hypothetical protein